MRSKNKIICSKQVWRLTFSMVSVAVFLSAFNACGLKTALQHDERELRPPIKWREVCNLPAAGQQNDHAEDQCGSRYQPSSTRRS